MAGIGDAVLAGEDTHDVPDSLIARFIDRLDHFQFRLLRPVEANVETHEIMLANLRARMDELNEIVQSHDKDVS